MPASIQVDTRGFELGVRKLQSGLDRASRDAARLQAEQTARDLQARTPVRSGRLRATVKVDTTENGAAVLYGGTLPYANYIAHKSRNVEQATADADTRFVRAATTAAGKVIAGL